MSENFDQFFNTNENTQETQAEASASTETNASESFFEQPQTGYTPNTNALPENFYNPPEIQPSRNKKQTGRKFGIGALIATLVLGTAAGFGGSALFNAINKKAASDATASVISEATPDTAENGKEFPFNQETPDGDSSATPFNGQMPEGGFGQMPEGGFGQRPEGGFPGSQEEAPSQEAPETSEDEEGSPSDLFKKQEDSESTETENKEAKKSGELKSLELSTKSNGEELSTEEIAAVTKDSVVEITTEYMKTGNYMQQYVSSGAGSGVIISEDGYIITNNHVIEDATQITVTTTDGNSYEATLVGRDDSLDVALLKIETTGLTPCSFGDSDQLNLAEKVIAIGNPLGQLGGSVSEGIISSLNRSITIDGKAMTLLQTDAAINPGNSGGGLFNDQGQLIGLVVAKSTGEDIDGIGFAIPINDVQAILNDLLNYGYTTGRSWLGVSLLDISNEQMARMYNVSETGTYLYSVEEGQAASKAGLQPGDRIVSIDGEEITSVDQMKSIIQGHEVGDTVTFVISRSGKQQTVEVTIGEYVPESMPTQNR